LEDEKHAGDSGFQSRVRLAYTIEIARTIILIVILIILIVILVVILIVILIRAPRRCPQL